MASSTSTTTTTTTTTTSSSRSTTTTRVPAMAATRSNSALKSPTKPSSSQTSPPSPSQSQPQAAAAAPAAPADQQDPPPPPLTYEVLTTDDAKRDALQLVADSIAQQRQVASLAVIFHPACLVAVVAACALAWRHNAARDVGTAMTACSGLVIAFLAAVRMLTSRYVNLAEAFRWRDFIAPSPASSGQGGGDEKEDLVLAARFGDELIGALVLRLVFPANATADDGDVEKKGGDEEEDVRLTRRSNKTNKGVAKNKRSKQQQQHDGDGRAGATPQAGLVRAWTTKLRYRGRGVGGDLLRFAVVTTRSACGGGGDDVAAPVSFDAAHANSALPLPDMFNRPFRARDDKARRALAHALRDCDAGDGSAFAFR
ncbi:hypothetical protein JDV02_009166 [Purpureocillium takamizusanense]|uniref:Uncharacterized protein n=1 Tax=Purpureocillium takamizusanense TaxID=2060973 RepID=A0A9Q8QND6_9HYPO|nr:uncharacterized protein JDV02_009166 [Purpureocillium takamizusanense]UNI23338.1 hypothetical protein JDV02_009166 [Purpureocillium takamizusanense]